MLSLTTPFAAWTAVIVSGLLEIVFAVAMKYSEGFTRLWPSVLSITTGLLSVWLIGLSMKFALYAFSCLNRLTRLTRAKKLPPMFVMHWG